MRAPGGTAERVEVEPIEDHDLQGIFSIKILRIIRLIIGTLKWKIKITLVLFILQVCID
jgi:hypothetical protein